MYWMISNSRSIGYATTSWIADTDKSIRDFFDANPIGVRPSLYLSSNVKIIGGDGNTTPYKLSL